MAWTVDIDPGLGAPVGSRWRDREGVHAMVSAMDRGEQLLSDDCTVTGTWFLDATPVDECDGLTCTDAQRLTANRLAWALRAWGKTPIVAGAGKSVEIGFGGIGYARVFTEGSIRAYDKYGAAAVPDIASAMAVIRGARADAIIIDDPMGTTTLKQRKSVEDWMRTPVPMRAGAQVSYGNAKFNAPDTSAVPRGALARELAGAHPDMKALRDAEPPVEWPLDICRAFRAAVGGDFVYMPRTLSEMRSWSGRMSAWERDEIMRYCDSVDTALRALNEAMVPYGKQASAALSKGDHRGFASKSGVEMKPQGPTASKVERFASTENARGRMYAAMLASGMKYDQRQAMKAVDVFVDARSLRARYAVRRKVPIGADVSIVVEDADAAVAVWLREWSTEPARVVAPCIGCGGVVQRRNEGRCDACRGPEPVAERIMPSPRVERGMRAIEVTATLDDRASTGLARMPAEWGAWETTARRPKPTHLDETVAAFDEAMDRAKIGPTWTDVAVLRASADGLVSNVSSATSRCARISARCRRRRETAATSTLIRPAGASVHCLRVTPETTSSRLSLLLTAGSTSAPRTT